MITKKDINIFQNIQSILDHNTIFLPTILDLKHYENSFQNLKRNMKDNNIKSIKTANLKMTYGIMYFYLKRRDGGNRIYSNIFHEF